MHDFVYNFMKLMRLGLCANVFICEHQTNAWTFPSEVSNNGSAVE